VTKYDVYILRSTVSVYELFERRAYLADFSIGLVVSRVQQKQNLRFGRSRRTLSTL